MASIEETLAAMWREIRLLLETAMVGMLTKARVVLEDAEQERTKGLAEVADERTKGLAELVEERAKGLAMVDARWAELHAEAAVMHKHKEAQEGRVELSIGGYHFHTSVQTLRRVPHTFFDAYFSGRHAQDVCDDGSIFVDRDGEHFGHVLEYMRDSHVSVAAPSARPSVSLLRALKREFGFYCIELVSEESVEAELQQDEVAYVMGGIGDVCMMSSMERYDASSGQWILVAAMGTARFDFGICTVAGELYVTGGMGAGGRMSNVEKYSPSSDTWSAVASLPDVRSYHAAVAVGPVMYVLGGVVGRIWTASVLKFDSAQGTWSQAALMPEVRESFAACAVGCDIFILGGNNARGSAQATVLIYYTVADEWSTLAPMPHACSAFSASVLDGLVYIVGANSYREVLRFDLAPGAWSTLAPTSSRRRRY
jgi:hypothetical protein